MRISLVIWRLYVFFKLWHSDLEMMEFHLFDFGLEFSGCGVRWKLSWGPLSSWHGWPTLDFWLGLGFLDIHTERMRRQCDDRAECWVVMVLEWADRKKVLPLYSL